MASFLATYERYLRTKAEAVAPAQLLSVVHDVSFPWVLAVMIAFLMVNLLDLPQDVSGWIIVPTTCLAATGIIYAGGRVAMYGWEFARTPATAAWTEEPAGKALIQALRRVTLNGLSSVTLVTRLQTDLRLTSADMSELLGILIAERWLHERRIEDVRLDDLTVEALLGLMSPA